MEYRKRRCKYIDENAEFVYEPNPKIDVGRYIEEENVVGPLGLGSVDLTAYGRLPTLAFMLLEEKNEEEYDFIEKPVIVFPIVHLPVSFGEYLYEYYYTIVKPAVVEYLRGSVEILNYKLQELDEYLQIIDFVVRRGYFWFLNPVMIHVI